MTISQRYFKYLDHFKETVPLREFHQRQDAPFLIGLRHDVDYCLDTALEMAYWEHQRGIRASYYLLHTAPYFNDPDFADKVCQIEDFGHEVGLHLNVLTEWFSGQINEVRRGLDDALKPFIQAGVTLTGMSSHGDSSCYQNGFINYWLFKELRPANPFEEENNKSAEGIHVSEDDRSVNYPISHQLKRADGEAYALWSLSMNDFGIDYDAVHLVHDQYYSDSGGTWKRTPDPIETSLENGRIQVLMHPLYWRGQPKYYFFLSTARSGSTWLSKVLHRATPANCRHEFSLNHRRKGDDIVKEKNTGQGLTHLLMDEAKVNKLLIESRVIKEHSSRDEFEANVYLIHVIHALKKLYPDAKYIHLYRDPKDVVRSIMNRDWYDTPFDTKHPKFDIPEWDKLSAFEKCCWYVAKVNEALFNERDDFLPFDEVKSDMNALIEYLSKWHIPFYPRLGKRIFDQVVNQNKHNFFPPYAEWASEQQGIFNRLLLTINQQLGYQAKPKYMSQLTKEFLAKLKKARMTYKNKDKEANHSESLNYTLDTNRIRTINCNISLESVDDFKIITKPHCHAHIILNNSELKTSGLNAGFNYVIGHYYQGIVEIEAESYNGVNVMCLQFDHVGKLIRYRNIHTVNSSHESFYFRPSADTTKFDVSIYILKDEEPRYFILKKVEINMVHQLEVVY